MKVLDAQSVQLFVTQWTVACQAHLSMTSNFILYLNMKSFIDNLKEKILNH